VYPRLPTGLVDDSIYRQSLTMTSLDHRTWWHTAKLDCRPGWCSAWWLNTIAFHRACWQPQLLSENGDTSSNEGMYDNTTSLCTVFVVTRQRFQPTTRRCLQSLVTTRPKYRSWR
jgi:hypothetical protein